MADVVYTQVSFCAHDSTLRCLSLHFGVLQTAAVLVASNMDIHDDNPKKCVCTTKYSLSVCPAVSEQDLYVMCRLLRLLSLLQHMFVMSLSAPQTTIPIIKKAVPTWFSYFCQLGYIIALFINFMSCVW